MVSLVNQNKDTLGSFIAYCCNHPEERFWQALRNWAGFRCILVSNECPVFNDQHDTFYWEGKTK
jgi:hypothetical protein